MPNRAPRHALAEKPAGYTLIELVVVMTVIGVLAATVGPKFFTQSVFSDRSYADELASALRATQKAAVVSGCPARLTLTANSYTAAQQAASGNTCNTGDTTWPTPVLNADGSTIADSAPAGESVSPVGIFVFNSSGGLSSSPGTTVAVGSRTLRIDAGTGFVLVQ